MPAIVQINFDYEGSIKELETAMTAAAPKFSGVDGLLWKVWLGNDTEKETGGIYLFASREHAEAYLASDMVAMLRQQKSNVVVKVFDVLEEPSALTSAPLTVKAG